MSFTFGLNEILEELQITRNKIAVESKIRPTTIYDMCEGKTKRIELETLNTILDTLNVIALEQGKNKIFTFEDVISYKFDQ